MISIISAIGENNEIGKHNELLWHLPRDMKHFKETTSGHTVIMGQKTFESLGRDDEGNLGRPLPNRRNIVLAKDDNFQAKGVEIVKSEDELMDLLEKTSSKEEENFIIGGGQIFKTFIDKVDKLYITHVDRSFTEADVFFPIIDESKWKVIKDEKFEKDEDNAYDMEFKEYIRK